MKITGRFASMFRNADATDLFGLLLLILFLGLVADIAFKGISGESLVVCMPLGVAALGYFTLRNKKKD